MRLFKGKRKTKYMQNRRNNKNIVNYNCNYFISINRYYFEFCYRKKGYTKKY